MNNLIEYFSTKTNSFKLSDWAIFKACMLFLGILIGTSYSYKTRKFKPLFIVGFVASCAYLVYKFFIIKESDKNYVEL